MTCRLLMLVGCLLACGHPGSGKPIEGRKDAGRSAGEAGTETAAAMAPLALGMASLDGFAYRARAGHPHFKEARDAEAKGDWAAVAVACEAALAADPGHLDAAYLLAVARAKQNQLEGVITPLAIAVAGDFGKWAQASLDQPALQKFLATPGGKAWRDRIESDRAAFGAMLARSLIVTAKGDLYAFDPETSRWLRLSRTGGAIVAAFEVRSVGRVAYITREKDKVKHQTKARLGIIDLTTGRARLAVELPSATAPIRVAYNGKKLKRFVVRVGNAWFSTGDQIRLALEPVAAKAQPQNLADLADHAWLDVSARSMKITRLGVPNVSADWNDQALASALRIGSSHRVITVPSPGLIQGNTLVWSPDGTQLALAAQLSDTCKPGEPTAAAYVADGATGTVQEIERATRGIAIAWVADRKLAVAGDRGVSIVDLSGGAPAVLEGVDGLAVPRFKPKCTPDEPEIEPPVTEDDPAETPTEAPLETGKPLDAGSSAK
jgi:hypothetical protein